jgi:ribosomal protein S18 acetylase RimI-like enzyme
VTFRDATPTDEPFLAEMLRLAFSWRDETVPGPFLPKYVAGFGREGDAGVVAEEDGTLVGAAWYRFLPADDPGYGYVEGVPELSIAVARGFRGRGVAGELLARLLDRAREDGLRGVSLSVEPDNPARRIYERLGFEKVGVSGGSWTMLRRLQGSDTAVSMP